MCHNLCQGELFNTPVSTYTGASIQMSGDGVLKRLLGITSLSAKRRLLFEQLITDTDFNPPPPPDATFRPPFLRLCPPSFHPVVTYLLTDGIAVS